MERTSPVKVLFSEALEGKPQAAAPAQDARSALHEDVLTHLTKSAVQQLGVSEQKSKTAAEWIVRAAKSVPLFCPAGKGLRAAVTYGSAAILYGASEVKWGDSAGNMTKDAVLGGLKGVGIKGTMDFIGGKMHQSGLDKRFWSAPAQGVAFGVTGTATETALTRATYYDETGNYRGLGYGLMRTGEATANLQNLALGAATFTLGAGSMKLLQGSRIARANPELIGNRVFHSSTTGFSFGAFSGMAEEAHKQIQEGKFSAWELHKFDYAKIGKHGLFMATSDAVGAAIGGKFAPPVTVEAVKRIDKPSEQVITDRGHLNEIVESPLRKAVTVLWDNNVRTTGSGVFHRNPRRWDSLGSPVHIGEYEAPYYKMTVGKDGRKYQVIDDPRLKFGDETSSSGDKKTAYIVLDDLALSAENQRIARQLGRVRQDHKIEIHVPVEPGTPAKQVEQAMLALARQFKPQPMTWGFKSPIAFYRERMNVERGLPTQEWMEQTINSPEFKQQGLVYDREHNLIFASKELAEKFKAAPPPEPTWLRGVDNFGFNSRGGWRQAYIQVAVNLYSLGGQRVEPANPATARIPKREFDLADLARPENAEYYLANRERFFELFGSKAYDALADRHWLELRNKAFESVENHWPSATLEKDRALALGSILLARACEGHGHFGLQEAGLISLFVPQHLWREPSGRRLTPQEVIDNVNKIYDDMDLARRTPFDHTFGKQLVDRMAGPEGDQAYDKNQFAKSKKRSLQSVLDKGIEMEVHPKYVPMLREILQKQSEGLIPERFEKTASADGLDNYTPVYRRATQEEAILPLSELVKNLKIVDYGFKTRQGPVLGKVSLASHDVHDHARIFWLLEREGLFDGTATHPGYEGLMGKLTDPKNTNIFRREGELIAQVATDWRSFYDMHPQYDPPVSLKDVRNYFLHSDKQGTPLSRNQSQALAYVEELIRTDPDGKLPESKKLRHIIGGVWQETLEQKRKTDSSLWQRTDGSYQRMSPTNPEYLAFVIDVSRVLQKHGHELWISLNENNLKMERYLRDVATAPGEGSVPKLRYTPDEMRMVPPTYGEPIVPAETRQWLVTHPGFNTRRAPVRNWLTGGRSEFDPVDPMEAVLAEMRRRDYQSPEWRRLLYGND